MAIRLLLATMRCMCSPCPAAQVSKACVKPEPSVIVMTGWRESLSTKACRGGTIELRAGVSDGQPTARVERESVWLCAELILPPGSAGS